MLCIIFKHSFVICVTLLLLLTVKPIIAGKRHVITFRSPNLFPEGVAYDHFGQQFVVGSFRNRSILAISDAGDVETLISDLDLPANVSFVGLAVDSVNHRLLAAVHAVDPLPLFDAVAAYDLRSRERIFLAPLSDPLISYGGRQIANDVAVDLNGNAYVTNSVGNFIWKVTVDGDPSIFSRSPAFTSQKIDEDQPWSFCGLNGIAYVGEGYLLVVQSNTGKMFKVGAADGKATVVSLPVQLTAADGIAVRRDGVVVVVSQYKVWFLKSEDGWGEGVVYDEIALENERFPTTVAIRDGDRAYVLFGHANEGMMGNVEREVFGIEEMVPVKENGKGSVWVLGLIGLGLGYALHWMAQLVKDMNKKRN